MLKKITLLVAALLLASPSAMAAEKAAVSKHIAIPFQAAPDLKALVKDYPFIKGTVDNAIQMDKSVPGQEPTAFSIAHISNPKRKLDLFFMRMDGNMFCGMQSGCAGQIYVDRGKGYKQAYNAYVDGPVFLESDGSDLVLSLCFVRTGGFSQWKLEGDTFVKKANSTKSKPPC